MAARARDGKTPVPDNGWSSWSNPVDTSPFNLSALPGGTDYLQLEFDLATSDARSTPKLRSVTLHYECIFES